MDDIVVGVCYRQEEEVAFFRQLEEASRSWYPPHMGDLMSPCPLLESSSTEKDLGVLADTKLNMKQQCTLLAKTSRILGCRRSVVSRPKEAGRWTTSTQHYWHHMWSAVSDSGFPDTLKDIDLKKRVQRRDPKMIKGLEDLSYKKRLREVGLFCLEKLWSTTMW